MQHPKPDEVVVAWRTDIASTGAVEYGIDGFTTRIESGKKSTEHAVFLRGLAPGTTYRYRVIANGYLATGGDSVKTRPVEPVAFKFVAFGDSGTGSDAQFAVARQISALQPDLILHTGDVIYVSGEAKHYDPRFFVPYRDIVKSTVMYLTIGNHDVGGQEAAPYLASFFLPTNNPEGTERYYSFDYGDAHFVCLYVLPDSSADYAPTTEQYRWLEKDLQSTSKKWKFVYFHPAPYSSWYKGSDVKARETLSPLFEKYGVDLVLTGHAHNYERTTPRLDFVAGGSPVTYVVTGGGGADLSSVSSSDFTAYSESEYHVVEISIGGDTLSLRAIRADGSVMDTFTKQK